ncbi:MAG: transposase [Bacteroidetes bacterium]|nr:MAG: transposase [Bacteroidota bacterium]
MYAAPNQEAAANALDEFEAKWGKKYGYAIQSWLTNWEDLTHYFHFPQEIRHIIYTTNVIESLNSGIRKYTRSKNAFPDDSSAMKAVYLAINNLEKKWTMTIRNWGAILNQFIIIFEDRCQH